MSNRISLVQSAKIASPCHASWDQMEGDERKRFCFQCRKHVYDFSKMTTVEVEELLKSESVCGRIWKRADGHVITADCPVGIKKRRERVAMWFAPSAATTIVDHPRIRPGHAAIGAALPAPGEAVCLNVFKDHA